MAPCAQLEGIENGPAIVENSPADPQKKNYRELPIRTLGTYPNEWKASTQICVHPLHSSIIHNGQGVRAVSVHQWMDG